VALFAALGVACGPSTPPPQQPDNVSPAAGGAAGTDTGSTGKVAEAEKLIADQKWDQAKSILESEVSSDPKNAKAVFYLGLCAENLHDADGAKSNYKKALEIDPKLVDAAVNLSALSLDTKDPTSALPVIKQGLEADPKNPKLLTNRALAYDDLGKDDEAAKAYDAALQVLPDDQQLRVSYVAVLMRLGKKDQVPPLLKIAVDKSSDLDVLSASAIWYSKLSLFQECVGAFDKAIKVKAVVELYVRRGVCKHGLNDETAARKDYEQAATLDPKAAGPHYYLGLSLAASDKTKALAELNKAVELDPSGEFGKRAKDEIDKLKGKKKK
jgi:tetratricopeptide (TPR) repeat protein